MEGIHLSPRLTRQDAGDEPHVASCFVYSYARFAGIERPLRATTGSGPPTLDLLGRYADGEMRSKPIRLC